MRITIDIDKEYNDKNIALGIKAIERLGISLKRVSARRSAHDRIHFDIEYIDELGYWLEEKIDYSDIADMYLILVRLAAGDDIKRVRSDALKWIRGGEIKHWIPAKEDYEKMKKEVRNEV
ncbi:MAG: hypothetical protein M1595_00495 [Candidatus Thermoplasmatota archaeon]|nr:hypothetical protein [Candidatus Thermoplasmatota archaeon]